MSKAIQIGVSLVVIAVVMVLGFASWGCDLERPPPCDPHAVYPDPCAAARPDGGAR